MIVSMLRLRVTYGRTADFLLDVEQQVSRRGLLVRADIGAVDRGVPVELELVTPVGRVVIGTHVLQPLPGVGVAVELEPAALAPLVEKVRRTSPADAAE